MIPRAKRGSIALYPNFSFQSMVPMAIIIRSTAYIKYITFDTVTQSLYIVSRKLKASPLVQSGDMSHDARTIAGIATIVTT